MYMYIADFSLCRHDPENELKSVILVGDKDVSYTSVPRMKAYMFAYCFCTGCCNGHDHRQYSRCIQVSSVDQFRVMY